MLHHAEEQDGRPAEQARDDPALVVPHARELEEAHGQQAVVVLRGRPAGGVLRVYIPVLLAQLRVAQVAEQDEPRHDQRDTHDQTERHPWSLSRQMCYIRAPAGVRFFFPLLCGSSSGSTHARSSFS